MSYTSQGYMSSPTEYYTTPHLGNQTQGHLVSPRAPESAPRKRPKYTRSKTGCLTCRVKKIKCDETKPKCMRCSHGSRDCTWPEGVPPRKKSPVKRDSLDGRPSTAGSSLSDSSSPPTRSHSPPRRHTVPEDIGLPHGMSRRHNSETYPHHLQLAPMPDANRPAYSSRNGDYHSSPTAPPLAPQYVSRYGYAYDNPPTRSSSVRNVSNLVHPTHASPPQHWDSPPMQLPPINGDSYYHNPHQERAILNRPELRHPPSSDHLHNGRY